MSDLLKHIRKLPGKNGEYKIIFDGTMTGTYVDQDAAIEALKYLMKIKELGIKIDRKVIRNFHSTRYIIKLRKQVESHKTYFYLEATLAKSDHYQYKIIEIQLDGKFMANIAEDQGLAAIIERNTVDPEIQKLQKELMLEIRNLIDKYLTKHQQKVIHLHFLGKTQSEIAQELHCTQSAVHKCLCGNIAYDNRNADGTPKVYGGIIKKLAKKSARSEKIQKILREIQFIKDSE